MSDDGNSWGPVGVPSDVVGVLAVRVVRDVAKALGLDLERAKAADIAPAVAAMRARVAELEAAARWVPVDSKLPDAGVPVLFVGPEVQQAVVVYVGGDDPWRLDADRTMAMEASEVTHWRPLPAGPEVQP